MRLLFDYIVVAASVGAPVPWIAQITNDTGVSLGLVLALAGGMLTLGGWIAYKLSRIESALAAINRVERRQRNMLTIQRMVVNASPGISVDDRLRIHHTIDQVILDPEATLTAASHAEDD